MTSIQGVECPSCGAANRPGVKFCVSCGARLEVRCPGCLVPAKEGDAFCGECGTALTATAGKPEPLEGSQPSTPGRPLPESFAGGRYQVSAFLGEGARKLVYRATDTRLGREVAIAEVKAEGLDDDALTRVWHEARSMARLGDHPNVVSVHDVIDGHTGPVVVSQFMAGGSLSDLLEEAAEHRLGQERAVSLAIDTCRALEHAHGQGVVHRDLKPANIWLDAGGRARLGDFGLALGTDGPRVTVEGMMLGTVAYMPPEQAVGREADPRSDLYALGAVLYEMLSGRPPFLGHDAVAVISQHLNTAPVLPTWFNSDIDPDLEALVMQLLAKAPEERPESAAEVEGRLAAVGAPAGNRTASPRPQGSAGTTWRFVGREAELAALRSAVDAAVSGRGSMVMLVGEPGIGKTRTTEQAGAYASVRGMQVLVGRCYEGDASIPYLPFIEAIRAHVMATGSDQLRSELGTGGSDVAKLVSEVRERVAELPPALSAEGPDQERRRLFDSVSSFLINASNTVPILLVLDDLHWCDKPSLLLLRHLARHLPTNRLLIVGTYRDVELDRRHPLSEILSDLRRDAGFERLLLRGLSADEVLDFLAAAGEREVDGPMRRLIPLLHRETEGNPFFLREVLVHMASSGQFIRRGDRWELADPDLSHLGIPEGVREVVGRRLSRLSEAANAALADAAVLGREFEFPVLALMQDLPEDALLELVEEALLAQLIVERRTSSVPTYAFSHALVRETLYDEVSLPRKQRKHLQAGQALEAVHVKDRDRILPILASHFRLAGAAADPKVTLDYALRAADAASAVFAWEDAAAHLETALEVMEDSGAEAEARADLATRIGDLIFRTSLDQARGIASLERALALYNEAGNVRRAAQVRSRLGRALCVFGPMEDTDVNRGMPHLVAAEKVLADGRDRSSLVFLYQSIAAACQPAGDFTAGLAAAEKAVAMSERLGDERLIASSAVFHGLHLAGSGQLDVGRKLMDSAREENHQLSQPFFRWCATTYGQALLIALGSPMTAHPIVTEELARLERDGSELLRHSSQVQLGQALMAMGRLEEAESAFAVAAMDPSSVTELLIIRGHWEEAFALSERRTASAQARGVLANAQRHRFLAAEAMRVGGRLQQARAILEELEATFSVEELVRRSRLVVICADLDDVAAAEGHLADLEGLPILEQDLLGASAYVQRARGIVAAARDQHDRALGFFSEAVECSRRHQEVFEEAESRRRRARSLAVLGRTEEALADLSVCLDLYERAGSGSVWTDPIVTERMAAQGVARADSGASIAVVAASVAWEKPDLVSHAASDGTVTLVFTDLGDSTSLNEKLGDRAWFEVLQVHHDMVRSLVERFGGTTVKSQGDGFMLAFSSARRALECAVAVQRAASLQTAGDEHLSVRIGIHTGEVLRQGEDFFGRHVNLAARVASAAQPGQILVSSLVRGLVSGDHELQFQGPRQVELKGFEQPESVYEVTWTSA